MSTDLIGFHFGLMVVIASCITAAIIPVTVRIVLYLCGDQCLTLKIYEDEQNEQR